MRVAEFAAVREGSMRYRQSTTIAGIGLVPLVLLTAAAWLLLRSFPQPPAGPQ